MQSTLESVLLPTKRFLLQCQEVRHFRSTQSAGLQEELKATQRDVAALQKALAEVRVASLAGDAQTLANGATLLAAAVDGLDAKSMQVRA